MAVLMEGPDADAFVATTVAALSQTGPQVMLTDGIAEDYRDGRAKLEGSAGVQELLGTTSAQRTVIPFLYKTTGAEWLSKEDLVEEVFGPLGLIVTVADMSEMRAIADGLQGQLTCTLHVDPIDEEFAFALLPMLQRKAGRLLFNGFPTGVEVSDSMV